jgi:hypothetical protein
VLVVYQLLLVQQLLDPVPLDTIQTLAFVLLAYRLVLPAPPQQRARAAHQDIMSQAQLHVSPVAQTVQHALRLDALPAAVDTGLPVVYAHPQSAHSTV